MARVAAAKALEDLHRSGLTGAVRAEKGEHLTLFDMEIYAPDGFESAIGLAKVDDLDCPRPHGSKMLAEAGTLQPVRQNRSSRAAPNASA